jgi:hypothetical protein
MDFPKITYTINIQKTVQITDRTKLNQPQQQRTFLLLSPLVTVYFRNDLVTDCFFRDKFKKRFIAQ